MVKKAVITIAAICALVSTSALPYAWADNKPQKGEEASNSKPDEPKVEQEISVSDPNKKDAKKETVTEDKTVKVSLQKKLSDLELKLVGPVFSTEL